MNTQRRQWGNTLLQEILCKHYKRTKSMGNIFQKKAFKLSLAAVAVSACLSAAPTFAASNTSGSIYGQAKPGAVITFKNKATGLSRSVTATEGRFNFRDVPPGTYEITSSNGAKRTIVVKLGTGSSVLFNQSDVETISVTGSKISAIDTTSAESTMVFTQEQVELLPIARNTTSIALLTPGTIQGDDDFGNLPSFGGSSVAENGYYIDGFDVTNLRSFLSFATLPFDAISQTQVKTGGYGAEYGRSLGGVTNIVTKGGTNDWEFGVAAYYAPQSLRSDRQDIVDLEGDGTALQYYRSDDTRDTLSYNISAGGPIIEDKLFVYGNVEFRDNKWEDFKRDQSEIQEVTNPNAIVKLDWYITDDHLLSATYIQNQTDTDYVEYNNPGDEIYTGQHGEEFARYTEEDGGDIKIINYNGHFTDNLSMSLMVGRLENKTENQLPRNVDDAAAECARAIDTTGDKVWTTRENIGCWNTAQAFIFDPNAGADKDVRDSFKIDFEYVLDNHLIRFGYNKEEYTSSTIGRSYSGGTYYRYFESHPDSSTRINGVEMPVGTQAVRVITNDEQSGEFKTENTAMYLEDSWQISDDLMLYGGLRNETFTNYAASGNVFVEADSLVAPRLGFAWDMDGDSNRKLYGTLGRYYIPIASNTNIRATRIEDSSQYFYHVDGFDAATGKPIYNGQVGALGDRIGGGYTDHQDPDPRVIAVSDLDPMYQDELVLGYQQALSDNWTGGIKLIYRDIQDGMDDFCGHDGFYNWAKDEGYAVATEETNWEVPEGGFDVHSMSGCLLVNPGKDLNLYADMNGNGEVEAISVPNSYFDLPAYKRTYKGLEFTLERAFADGWYANISYVLAKSEGNIEGYVNSTLGQEDAGATQDFDHKVFQEGSQGYLPNDRRHQIKAYGAYQLTEEITFTANVSIASGLPQSCNGYAPTTGMLVGDGSTSFDVGNFNRYGASTFYCVNGEVDANDNAISELTNRGDYGRSSWTYMVDAGVQYVPNFADGNLTLKLDVFNLFNFDKATEFDETKDFARLDPKVSKNFLQPTSHQAPRSMRLTARYAF
jgi:hypothetical protein